MPLKTILTQKRRNPPVAKSQKVYPLRRPFLFAGSRSSDRVKLIAGLISAHESKFSEGKLLLEDRFGPIDLASPITTFGHTDYYKEELGNNLKRIFYSFEKLIDGENAYKSKLRTQIIEKRLSCNAKRTVNIDPGYITLGKLILFTSKNYSHRIYLNKGIFAEVTLKFEKNSFMPWPWTYPDYRTKEYINFFNDVREIYKKQIKNAY